MLQRQELAELVAKMRRAQREYFRTRSDSALNTSKALETRVDEACRDILAGPSLFPEDQS